jgi:hypothetical protein
VDTITLDRSKEEALYTLTDDKRSHKSNQQLIPKGPPLADRSKRQWRTTDEIAAAYCRAVSTNDFMDDAKLCTHCRCGLNFATCWTLAIVHGNCDARPHPMRHGDRVHSTRQKQRGRHDQLAHAVR